MLVEKTKLNHLDSWMCDSWWGALLLCGRWNCLNIVVWPA